MSFKPFAALLALSLLAGCAVYREATSAVKVPFSENWRTVATDADRNRLRGWREAWDEALVPARAADAGAIAAEGALFDPDRAQADPTLPPGTYRCRTFKLGAKSEGMRDFTAYPGFECRVTREGELVSLAKVTGSQRPTGLLFEDSETRDVFLGTLVLGDETAPLRYGLDAKRDMVGYVERVGERRWRWVFPYPRFESILDVIELVPA